MTDKTVFNLIRGAGYPILPSTSVETNRALAIIEDDGEIQRVLERLIADKKILTVEEYIDSIGSDQGRWAYILTFDGVMVKLKDKKLE